MLSNMLIQLPIYAVILTKNIKNGHFEKLKSLLSQHSSATDGSDCLVTSKNISYTMYMFSGAGLLPVRVGVVYVDGILIR